MRILILSFSANRVNEDSFIPNKLGLTFACVDKFVTELSNANHKTEHICINHKNIKKCMACGNRGWGICLNNHKCVLQDDFNALYKQMEDYDAYIFITPVYFWEMSESAKTFFDRLKRCDAFKEDSKIKGKKIICVACAGGSGRGTEETLNSFDILNHFLKTQMVGRLGITKNNFNEQEKSIIDAVSLL